jgi:hypothetical protein
MAPPAPPRHPDIEPIAFLLGEWSGEGHGEYPTIESFDYIEDVHFWHVGKPFIAYTQRTRAADDRRPLHAEMGYFRVGETDDDIVRVEAVLSHPTGISEVLSGAVHTTALQLTSVSVVTTPTAKRVDATERTIAVDGDVLGYQIAMAAVGRPMTHHLTAELRRVDASPVGTA